MKTDKLLSALGKGFLTVRETEFVYGPSGLLLLRNIENAWWKHCVVSSKYNVYPTKISQVSRTLNYLKETSGDHSPFGLASIETVNNTKQHDVLGLALPASCQIMKVMTFVEKSCAKDLFNRKQRERKTWWRKFGSNPSRFVVVNSKNDEFDREIMNVTAQFPTQDLPVETISFGKMQCYVQEPFSGSNRELYVVEHSTSLELLFLVLLCDGYTEENESLHIHPKLAPYKALIIMDRFKNEKLCQLAVYLNNQLRAQSLNTIISYNSNDTLTLRVPYVILVDNESLKNGIVQVSNQLTTISEKVHIADLVNHIVACCS